ncbi:APC family permease [Streptomyces sp. SL13]|uniref:APC family permease n=1 Tax=Streptantibioticus silvisoli TaxID=2705255 RepID=A0AA90KBJ5_9ACTN|nr:APC family permease [Streptantibioticus silvisoli]MDI5973768.1 APC family permease [Streptantibioticus silvisoli]
MTGERARGRDRGTDPADRWRLSVFHLVGLAAGGVLGSGWVTSASKVEGAAGTKSWLVWLVGGLLMFVIAWVMVELAQDAPKTGGLIFLPLQTSGPLVATVVAAGLWIFYLINLVAEAVMMAHDLSWWKGAHVTNGTSLTTPGWLLVLAGMVVIYALNLLLPRIFFRVNSWITVLKIVIIVITVLLLAEQGHHSISSRLTEHGWISALTSVVGSGVIYTYVGFQGPLDFAGNVQRTAGRWRHGARRPAVGDDPVRERAREVSRLRWAVLGTLVGSVLLYTALQFAYQHNVIGTGSNNGMPTIADVVQDHQAGVLRVVFHVAGVLAPLGAGLVFAHALTREVAALGRAHLTHRGLQTARRTTMGRHHGIYWLVLLVNLCIGVVILCLERGNISNLMAVTGVLALIVYAMPAVVLVAQRNRLVTRSKRRRVVQCVLARVSFALIALVLYLTGWPDVWRGMVALAVGCVLLLVLPLVSLRWPGFGRFYDAKAHALLFRRWRHDAAAKAALILLGYLAALTLLTLWGNAAPSTLSTPGKQSNPSYHTKTKVLGGATVVVAMVAFQALVVTSQQFLTAADGSRRLPAPATAAG